MYNFICTLLKWCKMPSKFGTKIVIGLNVVFKVGMNFVMNRLSKDTFIRVVLMQCDISVSVNPRIRPLEQAPQMRPSGRTSNCY